MSSEPLRSNRRYHCWAPLRAQLFSDAVIVEVEAFQGPREAAEKFARQVYDSEPSHPFYILDVATAEDLPSMIGGTSCWHVYVEHLVEFRARHFTLAQ